jgi:hypothetical protein
VKAREEVVIVHRHGALRGVLGVRHGAREGRRAVGQEGAQAQRVRVVDGGAMGRQSRAPLRRRHRHDNSDWQAGEAERE